MSNIASKPQKPGLALWFRYGPAEHSELFHALPSMIETLSDHFEITYFSLTSREKPAVPEDILRHANVIQWPIKISRLSNRDKWIKSLLWILATPILSLWTRAKGIRYVYIDETLPLVMPIARLFFGDRITMTVADLFLLQYAHNRPGFKAIGRALMRLDLWVWNQCPFLITRAASSESVLRQMGVTKPPVLHAYDAIDVSLYHPRDRNRFRAEWGWASEQIVIVFHGVLHPNKDLMFIIRSLRDIMEVYPELTMVLLGNGPEEKNLKQLTRDLSLENRIHFEGYTEPKRVATALCAADIGLVSRRGDAGDQLVITSVLGHCLACRIAVLASKTKGISEIIEDGSNGLLFEPGNEKSFAHQLKILIQDPERRETLAHAGLQTAKDKLSLEETIRRNTAPFIHYWGSKHLLTKKAQHAL